MTERNSSESSRELVMMEYEKLQDYYMWSLGAHTERLDLYVKLLAATMAACFSLTLSSFDHRYEVCGGLAAAFLVIGALLLERLVSSQITNIWCIVRLNALRALIREKYGLEQVFRPIPIGSLKKDANFRWILKYSLKSGAILIVGNSLAGGCALLCWGIGLPVIPLLFISVAAGAIAWVLQIWYYNTRYASVHKYLVYDEKIFREDEQWMKVFLRKQTVLSEKHP